MFKKVQSNQNFPKLEEEILAKWKKEKTFQKSLDIRKKSKKSIFFDGPPFANGMPHYGHILISTVKDAVARYKTMKGFLVPRVAGWDCHGLPVENEVEKTYNLKGHKDVEKLGVAKFNTACRASVFKYTKEWNDVIGRLGRWVDFEHAYATLNNDYMESIWWVFKQIWDKKLVYQGYKPMHISTALETPLSNFEVSLNYKDITDYALTAKFELEEEPGTFLLAWTTTPWTLPGNQALAIGGKIIYSVVEFENQKYIVAKNLIESVFKDKEYKVVGELLPKQLEYKRYKPLFPYYQGIDLKNFQIFIADFVTAESGTGIVHIAGGFGEDDFYLIEKQGMKPIVHVEMNGSFKKEVTDFAGKYVKAQDHNMGEYLKKKDLFFSSENYRHSYPHCWRTDTPLLNYVTTSWFVKVTAVKDKMLKNNQKINWQPEHIKNGRFGKWLEGARDWSISRNRFWGCPIPIWKNKNGDTICISSMKELEKLTGGKLPKNEKGDLDLHKPQIDEITFMHPDHAKSKDEKYLMKRIPDVFDCWFESGSMPYAELHYPFENKKEFEKNFPADFIIEAIDQTRGWFYTLHVLATILFNKPAFENVIVTGHINAANGEKLSKRKKNFEDPSMFFERKGVDTMRFFLLESQVVLGEGVRFSETAIDELMKKFTLTIWNTYSFFVTYANIDGWTPKKIIKNFKPKHSLDQWILSEMSALIKEVTEQMEVYNLCKATRPLVVFADNLSNWYIRRSRRRFWKSEDDNDKAEAYQTLYVVLTRFAKLLAPFMPFLAEEIYTNLTGKDSVHLSDWPEFRKELFNARLNQENSLARLIVTLGHAARDKAKIKVRQPLALAQIALPENIGPEILKYQTDVIKEELNVKNVEIIKNTSGLVKAVVTPLAKVLGPKYGADVQEIIKLIKAGDFSIDGKKIKTGGFVLEEGEFELGYESIDGLDAASNQGITVVLNTKIDQNLLYEGYAREIVRFVQELRKDAGYEVNNRIILNIQSDDKELESAITQFGDYIREETLANELQQSGDLDWDKEKILEFDFKKIKVAVKKFSKYV